MSAIALWMLGQAGSSRVINTEGEREATRNPAEAEGGWWSLRAGASEEVVQLRGRSGWARGPQSA